MTEEAYIPALHMGNCLCRVLYFSCWVKRNRRGRLVLEPGIFEVLLQDTVAELYLCFQARLMQTVF